MGEGEIRKAEEEDEARWDGRRRGSVEALSLWIAAGAQVAM